MEAIGRLAGGVAHDFNNMLTAILGYAQLALADAGPDEGLRGDLEEIVRAGESAAGLTRQLLAFSRRQMLAPRVVDLNEIVAASAQMRARLIGEHVELATVLDPDLGAVKVDPAQIEQVILNLAINARDAMPAGGKLTIETANVELDDGYARAHADVEPGPYVMLVVSDTGAGMDADARVHLFEPFFTTKDTGTGLGLATVHGIVHQSGGHVWVYSEPGLGTSFKVYFPRVAPAAGERPAAVAATRTQGGDETVLLVEDEDGVRRLVGTVLGNLGYTVLEAATPGEALALAAARTEHVALIVTDIVLPGMHGRELAEELVRTWPRARVLYVSGYAEDAIVEHGVLAPDLEFLPKPFTASDLGRKVREVLDAPDARA
jgi:CheY-like chemotaxis protein